MTRLHTHISTRFSWLAPLLFCGLAFGQNGALRLTEPAPSKDGTIVTSEPAIYLKGTLAGTGGARKVLWESSRGFSDLAAVTLSDDGKTARWSSASPVPLGPGVNHVRIKALGQPGAATSVNIYYALRSPLPAPVQGTTIFHGKQITYEVRDGFAIYQSDMILGKAADVAAAATAGPPGAKSTRGPRPESLTITPGISTTTELWPSGRVPYTITNVPADTIYPLINNAITESNTQLSGVIQWVQATGSDLSSGNYVDFDFDTSNFSGACEAVVGMQGNGVPQPIGGSGACTETTILHEMGHALGLFHEQSRADRNAYVNYMEQNIDKPNHANFDIIGSDSIGSGLYNYASIMEYGPFAFDKDGVSPSLETIPSGMVLGTSMPKYTTGDLDGIMRLYGHTPTSIIVDTNPSGLQVIVDGTTCTAPCTFATWTTGSSHTLSIPTANQTLQTLSGQNYIFGRWNAGLANVQNVTIVNALGDGTLLRPTTAPSITNYLASFIPVHPYSPVVSPSGHATITPSPAASTSLMVNGAPTYLDRQLVTLTVAPNTGYSFYRWYPSPFLNLYTNPFTFYVTEDLNSTTAQLVTDAVTTITAASPDLAGTGLGVFPGFAIGVTDGMGNHSTAYTPVNFDASFNGSGFASTENLTFTAASESPVTTNISYSFTDWTGAGTPSGNSLSVTVPASGISTSTANFTPRFRSIVDPAIGTATYCSNGMGGNELTVSASPAGTDESGTFGNVDAFFNSGTVTFTASPGASGLSFVGWTQDLAAGGTAASFPFSLTGQTLGTANFNLSGIAAPLSITSVSTPTATTASVNLTITGTGFATATSPQTLYTYFGPSGLYRSNTPNTSTQLTMTLNAGDIATPGYYQLTVLNSENTTGCSPSATVAFVVSKSTGPPVLAISKSPTGSFNQGQQNATYTLLVTNNGAGPTVDPVTVTETVSSGLTLVSMAGSGWTCSGNTCSQSTALGAGLSYGAITVTVDVAANATSPQVNTATVFTATGGGASTATATDPITIIAQVPVPNVVGDTQSAATSAITGAGLMVGTVTMQSSGTVASGDVISESPVAGTMVAAGSMVNLVVSTGAATGGASATYTGVDTTTQGTWTGKYGADGYLIANDATNPPAYATVSLSGDATYTWAASTTTASALQVSSGSSTRIASCYDTATSFNINVNLTDGNTHRIALYLLDWTNGSRGETISILNAVNNAVLSTQTFSSFSQGVYAIWNVQGNVIIQVTRSAGVNAVVSGIFFDPAPTSTTTSATYTGVDTMTQGTWTGKYGADGYLIANDATNPPAYATVSLSGDATYTWAASTTTANALQVSSGSSTRIASCYDTATSFNINVNLTDGNTHRIALYLLDWTNGSRGETISILNAVNNAVLSTQTFSSFSQGEYAIWNVQGNVIIQVTRTAGVNAVVSGIFFDPAPTIAPSATYSGVDTTTQGTWTGKYGANGYLIANDATNPPAYATVSLSGDATYTWAASTTTASALQVSSGSSTRIASCYDTATSFNINVNLTDGSTHRIALYLLDWTNGSRGETISILNAANNAVLSTQMFSSFSQGVYAIWNVQGNVIIQVTRSAGVNAVVSGIFFDPAPTSTTTSATYTGVDTMTQGTWTGKYGADGYLIANDATNPPAYATVSLSGDATYTWAASTTTASALQVSSGSSTRIASCYDTATSFNINVNLTDGNTHRIALYLLDWTNGSRGETISILNAVNNAVLSTQTFSSFSQGEYAIWNVQGNVIIQVTRTAGVNAVVSGIFFN